MIKVTGIIKNKLTNETASFFNDDITEALLQYDIKNYEKVYKNSGCELTLIVNRNGLREVINFNKKD